MTTDGQNRGGGQSANRRLVRIMVVATLVILAMAFGLYAFAAWSEAGIACAPGAEDAERCAGASRAAQVFGVLTAGALLGAVFAWRKLNA